MIFFFLDSGWAGTRTKLTTTSTESFLSCRTGLSEPFTEISDQSDDIVHCRQLQKEVRD